MLTSWTSFIWDGSIKECVIHEVREKVRLRWLESRSAVSSLQRHHLDHRCFRLSDPDQANRLVSLLFLCCHLVRGRVSALSWLPAQALHHDYVWRQHQIRRKRRTWGSPTWTFCVSLYRCTSLYLSINLLIPLPLSSFERCPVLVQRAFRLVSLLWWQLFNRRTLRLTVLCSIFLL